MTHATAIGCRVKSGWAMVVLVTGPRTAPRVLDRRHILLSDPRTPRTRQPWHKGFGMEQTDLALVRGLTRIIARCADRSVAQLLRDYRALGHSPRKSGIVVGSLVDPAAITNPHIRAHA